MTIYVLSCGKKLKSGYFYETKVLVTTDLDKLNKISERLHKEHGFTCNTAQMQLFEDIDVDWGVNEILDCMNSDVSEKYNCRMLQPCTRGIWKGDVDLWRETKEGKEQLRQAIDKIREEYPDGFLVSGI
jgi:hypothetical protein